MKDSKCKLLEDAIDHTNDNAVSVNLEQLKDILSYILKVKKLDD